MDNQRTDESYYGQLNYHHIFPIGKNLLYNGIMVMLISNKTTSIFLPRHYLPQQKYFVDIVGFDYMEQLANRYAVSGLKYQLEPSEGYFFSALFNYGYYELEDFNLVQEGEVFTKSGVEEDMFGVGLELGMLVRQFGPLMLRSEYNFNTEKFNAYLRIGYAF